MGKAVICRTVAQDRVRAHLEPPRPVPIPEFEVRPEPALVGARRFFLNRTVAPKRYSLIPHHPRLPGVRGFDPWRATGAGSSFLAVGRNRCTSRIIGADGRFYTASTFRTAVEHEADRARHFRAEPRRPCRSRRPTYPNNNIVVPKEQPSTQSLSPQDPGTSSAAVPSVPSFVNRTYTRKTCPPCPGLVTGWTCPPLPAETFPAPPSRMFCGGTPDLKLRRNPCGERSLTG